MVPFFSKTDTMCPAIFQKTMSPFQRKVYFKRELSIFKKQKNIQWKKTTKTEASLFSINKPPSKGFRKNVVFFVFRKSALQKEEKTYEKTNHRLQKLWSFQKIPKYYALVQWDFRFWTLVWFLVSIEPHNRHLDKKSTFTNWVPVPLNQDGQKSKQTKNCTRAKPLLSLFNQRFCDCSPCLFQKRTCADLTKQMQSFGQFSFAKILRRKHLRLASFFFFKRFLWKKETRTLSEIYICISFQKRKILRKMFSNSKIKNLLILLNPFWKKFWLFHWYSSKTIHFAKYLKSLFARIFWQAFNYQTFGRACPQNISAKEANNDFVGEWGKNQFQFFSFQFLFDESLKKKRFFDQNQFFFLQIFSQKQIFFRYFQEF